MDKLFDIFSTRELSIIIWLGLALTVMMFSKNIRKGIGGVVKGIFGSIIGTILLLLAAYVSLLIYFLYNIDFWSIFLLKDTIFWFCTTALVLFFTINNAKTNIYFKDIFKENLKWAIIIEFIVNFYTFSFWKELLLVPVMVFLAMLLAFAQADNKFIQVSKLLENLFAIIGIALLGFVTYMTFTNYQDVFKVQNLFTFLLPPFLTVLLIPFLYLVAIYMNYEELFARINCMTNDYEKKKLLKREIVLVANLNINRLDSISKNINKFYWYHSDDIKTYIKSLIQ